MGEFWCFLCCLGPVSKLSERFVLFVKASNLLCVTCICLKVFSSVVQELARLCCSKCRLCCSKCIRYHLTAVFIARSSIPHQFCCISHLGLWMHFGFPGWFLRIFSAPPSVFIRTFTSLVVQMVHCCTVSPGTSWLL